MIIYINIHKSVTGFEFPAVTEIQMLAAKGYFLYANEPNCVKGERSAWYD